MNFKKWVKSIQTAGYNGARTVSIIEKINKVKTSVAIVDLLANK